MNELTDNSEIPKRPIEGITVRATALPMSQFLTTLSDSNDLEFICEVWPNNDWLQEALELASPSLAAQLDQICSGKSELSKKRLSQARESLTRYLIRATTRATPFGTFAGISPVSKKSTQSPLEIVTKFRRRARLSQPFSEDITSSIVGKKLIANPSLFRRGNRICVPVLLSTRGASSTSSVRATPALNLVLDACASSQTYDSVICMLETQYASQSTSVLNSFLDELVRCEILISSKRASLFCSPSVVDNAPENVVESVEAYEFSGQSSGRKALQSVKAEIEIARRLNRNGDEHKTAAAEAANSTSLHVDLELQVEGAVPPEFYKSARSVLVALAKVTHAPATSRLLALWSEDFEERYGTSLVPLHVATDPVTGLGMPDFETDTAVNIQPSDTELELRRIRIRGELLERARLNSAHSVELRKSDLNGIIPDGEWASSYDVFFNLHRTQDRLTLALAPTGVNFPAGRASGRFAWSESAISEEINRWAAYDREVHKQGVVANVNCLVHQHTVNRLATTKAFHPTTLDITSITESKNSQAQSLRLSDLYLGVRRGRTCIYLKDGTPVHLRQLSMVTPRSYPDLVRFLFEIESDGYIRPSWSWGPFDSNLYYLPQVTFDGIVLSEERWRWPDGDDPTTESIRAWAKAAGVSRFVHVGLLDNRLYLDLGSEQHQAILASEIKSGSEWVVKAPDPETMAALSSPYGSHTAEVVVSLPSPEDPGRRPAAGGTHFDVSNSNRNLEVGSEWTYLTIAAPTADHSSLARELEEVIGTKSWYYVRYKSEGQGQLRIRVNAYLTDLSALFSKLRFLREQHRVGEIAIRTYERELERYGGSESFSVWEQAFAVESRVLLATDALSNDPADDIDYAAGLVEAWLETVAPSPSVVADVLGIAVTGYSNELGAAAYAVKKESRKHAPRHSAASNSLKLALNDYWNGKATSSADRTPGVLQSALHLFCNRLGLNRTQEFTAIRVVEQKLRGEMYRHKAERNRNLALTTK